MNETNVSLKKIQKQSQKLETRRTLKRSELADHGIKPPWYIENPSTQEPLCFNDKPIVFSDRKQAKSFADTCLCEDEYRLANKSLPHTTYLLGDHLLVVRTDTENPDGSYTCYDHLTDQK